MDPNLAWLLFSLLTLGSLGFLWSSHRANRRFRLVTVLPTSRTRGVFMGLVELAGTAETSAPFTSFLTGTTCVLYQYSVSEEWSRTVTETVRDAEGRTQTRTRVETGWTTVDHGGESAAFYVQDDTGVVLIQPAGAETRPYPLLNRTCSAADPLYYGRGPAGGIMDSTGRRSFTESGIPLHARVFIVGQARERGDVVAPEIAVAPGVPLYLLTVENEAQVLKRFGRSRDWTAVFGLLFAGGAGWLLAQKILERLPLPVCLAFAGGWLLLWALSWVWMVYNALIDTRNRVRQGWSLIDVQLSRRHDLLPPLIASVSGLRDHERDVQESIAALRGQQDATGPGQSGPDYHGVARQLRAVAERYPALRTDTAFLRLQEQLTETEQRIALARDYFNDIATAWNTRIGIFPDNLLARLSGFQPQPLLYAEDFERAEVRVDFSAAPAEQPAAG